MLAALAKLSVRVEMISYGETRSPSQSILPVTEVPSIQACLVDLPVDRDPIGSVDSSTSTSGGARGECAGDLDPTILLPGDFPDLARDLGEVLILAEEHRYVVGALGGQSDDVDGNADVDSLLLADHERSWIAL